MERLLSNKICIDLTNLTAVLFFRLVIGAHCKRPLKLALPIFVSDMSFGALSKQAKMALSKGAEIAGTGICSGEGGSLDSERELNTHYFYEIAVC